MIKELFYKLCPEKNICKDCYFCNPFCNFRAIMSWFKYLVIILFFLPFNVYAHTYNCNYDSNPGNCHLSAGFTYGNSTSATNCDNLCSSLGYICTGSAWPSGTSYPGDLNWSSPNNYYWSCTGSTLISLNDSNICSRELIRNSPDCSSITDPQVTGCVCRPAPQSKDDLNFVSPVNIYSYDKNNFYWAFNYEISTSTQNILDNQHDLIIYINWTNNDTKMTGNLGWNLTNFFGQSVIVLPDTFTVFYGQDINEKNVPTELGNYNATATMAIINYNDSLISDIISTSTTFEIVAIGSSTAPIKPSATTTENQISYVWCENLCVGMETNWYNILNNIYCAGKYLGCWAFLPHRSTLENFNNMYELYKTKFPMSAYYELASTTQYAFNTASTTTSDYFSIPMIRKTGTSSEYYMLPVLTSSSTSNLIGSTNATSFRNGLKIIIWLVFAIIILLQIF